MERNPVRMLGALILILVGLLWTFQGLGVIGGSFMSGQVLWLVIGLLVFAGGAVVLVKMIRDGR